MELIKVIHLDKHKFHIKIGNNLYLILKISNMFQYKINSQFTDIPVLKEQTDLSNWLSNLHPLKFYINKDQFKYLNKFINMYQSKCKRLKSKFLYKYKSGFKKFLSIMKSKFI